MRLVYGKEYKIRRVNADEKNKKNKEEIMSFVGVVNDTLLLFRHRLGYKEAFLKRLVGREIFISEVRTRKRKCRV